jgi:hypothetical protein
MIPCDGCRQSVEAEAVRLAAAEGNQARYCEDCRALYQQFLAACLVTEEKFNRLLDQEITAIRERVPLLFVPQDLPRRARPLEGLILG